jgi:hypothetical protein
MGCYFINIIIKLVISVGVVNLVSDTKTALTVNLAPKIQVHFTIVASYIWGTPFL